jgi:DNA repair protein RecO (recombination protein O)
MRQLRDEGYVLRTQPLGEADLIVSLFTLEHGMLRGVARAARRSRRRFGAALEPLTRVRALWVEHPGRELARIDSVEGQRSFAAMQGEPAIQAACGVVSEVCAAFVREEQPDPQAFRLVGAVLDALERHADVLTVMRYFEYWMLRIHGLLPEFEACGLCGAVVGSGSAWADPRGRVLCVRCATASDRLDRRLGPDEIGFLRAARLSAPLDLEVRGDAARPRGALETLLRGALETFAETRFRSYRHLRLALAPGGAP